jgi:hypothetical protein
MTIKNVKGAFIASAVAGLFASAGSAALADHNPNHKDGEQVVCSGINACKGTGSCAGAGHACGGQNGCKGQGHTKTTRKDCLAKGGKIVTKGKDSKKAK